MGTLAGTRIATVISSIEPGGAERIAVGLCGAWAQNGAAVTIVALRQTPRSLPLPANVELIHVEKGATAAATSFLRRAGPVIRRLLALRRVLKAAAADIVVSHMDQTNVMTLLASRGLGTPVIVTEHVDPRIHPIGRHWALLRTLTYGSAARIVTVSEGMRKAFRRALRQRTAAIPNFIELPEVQQRPALGGKHIVAMGRLTHQKGFDLLVRAFALVSRRHPDASLTIWGRGPDLPALEALASELGLAHKVRFPGYTDDPVKAFLSGSVFALPSRYEGFGLVLAEALALGLPAVATRCPSGPEEIIEHGVNGLLVPVEDADGLAAALNSILEDGDLAERLSAAGRAAREQFSPARAVEAWTDLLVRVRSEAGGDARPPSPKAGPE